MSFAYQILPCELLRVVEHVEWHWKVYEKRNKYFYRKFVTQIKFTCDCDSLVCGVCDDMLAKQFQTLWASNSRHISFKRSKYQDMCQQHVNRQTNLILKNLWNVGKVRDLQFSPSPENPKHIFTWNHQLTLFNWTFALSLPHRNSNCIHSCNRSTILDVGK